MALSNMRREPRREITETVVGVIVFGAYVVADWYFAQWFQWVTGPQGAYPWPAGMVLGILVLTVGTAAVIALPFIVHNIGDFACEVLGLIGLDPRPRQRY